ncbi:hypothetical protein ONR57_21420 [Hoyosella sp. YIM 151337]|uniref:hypothetical protein n=1 Tax=Hoyosella sp. YIM 151337 TaxID=2992742 RepID=UPI002235BA74|nr:hypothetical protein [Hoyosella sp. YIM 151337]MCW4355868.1 hypothetical protein [Hoyosella sp. YIM 151337]
MSTSAANAPGHAVQTANWTRWGVAGAVAGIVASLVMAMYAMIAAATYQGVGFFTPLYHIASSVISGEAMMESMEAGMAGDNFVFIAGPAIVGALVHMMIGAGYGIVFAAFAKLVKLQGAAILAAAGAVYGFLVFVVSSWVLLPLTASILGGGDPIRDMPTMVGYPTFIAEHILFGLVIGLLLIPVARKSLAHR